MWVTMYPKGTFAADGCALCPHSVQSEVYDYKCASLSEGVADKDERMEDLCVLLLLLIHLIWADTKCVWSH